MLQQTVGYKIIHQWLKQKKFEPFEFQTATWQAIIQNKSGIINAPTGCGKTFSVFLGFLIHYINQHPTTYQKNKNLGLQLIWVTPLRALAKDIGRAMQEVLNEIALPWKIGIRNGDTTATERAQQKKQIPEILIITPESLHLLLAQKNVSNILNTTQLIAVDEWHELLGSKRGVMIELAISKIQQLTSAKTQLMVWGISATIGNLQEAKQVLLYALPNKENHVLIKANINKQIKVIPIIPEAIEKYPWAGHLGIKLIDNIIEIIEKSNTTLIFINTRGMSEMWYQSILTAAPQLAGAIALHHGSIEQELRVWVEEALHTQKLKAVVCTASLDLGVDFRPVDTVIQVGSPKGISRFLQRAGRSGHKPGDISTIYFLPTHSLELVEAAALTQAIQLKEAESKQPLVLCYDVLIQYLCTLAVGDGFYVKDVFKEIKNTFCFSHITEEEWQQVIQQITTGGKAFDAYDEFKKVEIAADGLHKIINRRIAMRHRLHIGTIVSDAMLKVKMLNGSYVGVIEEWFISRLNPGDSFIIAGKNVELVAVKEMEVMVKKSTAKKTIVPSWMGGRMSLTANLGSILRNTFQQVAYAFTNNTIQKLPVALQALEPLFQLQQQLSVIPSNQETLIEYIATKQGYHLLVYPFEGRQIHEAMSALLAYRITKTKAISFSIAMNDYGFELLSDKPLPINTLNFYELFSNNNLLHDIQQSINATEMAKRKFRDIAVIGGLIFQGMPGQHKKAKHLQSSASLLFKVMEEYDSSNILLRQAYNEVMQQQMEEERLRNTLNRMVQNNIIVKTPPQPTPLSFPIIADGLNRNNISSETLEDRIKKMQAMLL